MSADAKSLRAVDVMTRSLVFASPQQALLEAEQLLFEHKITGMPVVDEGRLVGVLSASDVARVQIVMNSLDGQVNDARDWPLQADGFKHAGSPTFNGFGQLLAILTVADAMRAQVTVCSPETSVAEIAQKMLAQRIHRIIVVEEGERPVGIVSSLDVVRVLTESAGA